jgi:tetratricopeptide (TPR) repeat protein
VTRRAAAAALVVVLAMAPTAVADPSPETMEQLRQPPAGPTPDREYYRGVRARAINDWAAAEAAFRQVVAQRPAFADAWNELGFALRHLGRYEESIRAYDEALRLRSDFPEALEYLGEAYVKMGRLTDARGVLERLRPLDAGRARELAEFIEKGE